MNHVHILDADAPSHRHFDLTRETKYWICFVASFGISLLLIFFSYDGLADTMPDGSLAGDVTDFWTRIASGSSCLVTDIAEKLGHGGGCGTTHAPLRPEHGAVTVSSGVAQIVGVLAISFLWFFTFILPNLRYRFFSLLPTCAYVWGMFNAYQPAVLVAALVAIYVAAEHYGELRKTSDSLEHVVNSVVRISESAQLIMSKAGLKIFHQEICSAYGRANTICSVIRFHAIEDAWWWRAEKELANQQSLEPVWSWYQNEAGEQGPTLYRALTQERVGPNARRGNTLKSAYFVSYMCMPGSPEWLDRKPADQFEDLLGLAWECLLLARVRNALGKIDSIGEWISTPLCWAHVTDKEVWQVMKRAPTAESTAMKTADLIRSTVNRLDPDLSGKIIASTQAEIRRYLRRGMRTEEYLCSVFCFYDPDIGLQTAPLAANYFAELLKKLGMEDWLADKERESNEHNFENPERKRIRRDICVAIFVEFTHLCLNEIRANEPGAAPTQNLFLAQEVL